LPSATQRCAAAADIPVIHVLSILSGARSARGQAALPPLSFARMRSGPATVSAALKVSNRVQLLPVIPVPARDRSRVPSPARRLIRSLSPQPIGQRWIGATATRMARGRRVRLSSPLAGVPPAGAALSAMRGAARGGLRVRRVASAPRRRPRLCPHLPASRARGA